MSRERGASPGAVPGSSVSPARDPWPDIRTELRSRGLRWTPQRKLILDVLGAARGHVTGSEIVERCRTREPETTPSTVYRTLAVLEELGYLHHSHAAMTCGRSWEIAPLETASLVADLEGSRGFRVDVGHLTIAGRCEACSDETG